VTHQDVRNLIAALATLWPNARIDATPVLLRTWAAVLADIDITEAEAAVVILARSGAAFAPAPGAIVAAVLDMRDRASGDAAPGVDVAWAEVTEAIRSRGWSAGPPESWSHPAIADAVRAVTWRELCLSSPAGVVRAHFLRMYETAAARSLAERREHQALTAGDVTSRALPRHTHPSQ